MEMFSEVRCRKLFNGTSTLWVLFAFIAFLNVAGAIPQSQSGITLSRRAAEPPGIGVEFEYSKITIKRGADGRGTISSELKEQLKGRKLTPIDYPGGEPKKNNWELTVELGRAADTLFPEAIIDGLKNKVG